MLDKIDRKLLCLLQQDCTLSLQALADAVNLTTTPCWNALNAWKMIRLSDASSGGRHEAV